MADQPATAAVERGDHRVGVLRAREEQHRQRLLGDLGADVVDQGVVQVRGVVGLRQPARRASGDETGGEPGGAEERSATAPVRAPSAVRLPIRSPWSSRSR